MVAKCHRERLTQNVQELILRWEHGDRPLEDYAILQIFSRIIIFRPWFRAGAYDSEYGLPEGEEGVVTPSVLFEYGPVGPPPVSRGSPEMID